MAVIYSLSVILGYDITTMKHTVLMTFLVCVWLTIFSCDNPKRNSSSTTVSLKVTDSLEQIKTAFFKMDTLSKVPDDIQTINGKVTRVLKVDFNGDSKPDFICQYEPMAKTDNADYLEDWITSDKQLFKRVKKYSMDFDLFWFVNLDNDPEPEIFSATGYEDGIDYAFYDQDLKTAQDNLLFYFNPIILENGKNYWGYPWDISDLILKTDSTNIYLKTSVDNDIENDGNITIPDSTKKFPAIFFYGHSTQSNVKVEAIRNIKWATLDELK